jgi:hypothetical protein
MLEILPSSKPAPLPFSHNRSNRLTVRVLAFYDEDCVKKRAMGLLMS